MTVSERLVTAVGNGLAKKSSRRGFLFRSAVVGSALALNPWRWVFQPGTAYASLCGPDASCSSGWTVFCCSINAGRNACPPGSIPAGWWKTDRSGFCEGSARYIIDCNATCGSCGCGGGGICAPGCYSCGCHCGSGSCDERLVCCNQFRYGQCHQELACVGPVVCRVASCRPPWEVDPTCTTASATANQTALHTAPCLDDSGKAFVTAFGGAPKLRSPKGRLGADLVGVAATPSGRGCWLVGADGGIFSFGDAGFHGSAAGDRLEAPVVGMAATHSGRGYWLVTAAGAILSFGDARFHGSTRGRRLHQPVVGIVATRSGKGYWLVAADGGIFAFGDARFHGSTGKRHLNQPIVGMARTRTGHGYWLVAADGGIFSFGDARFHGGLGASGGGRGRTVGMAASVDGGYWLASQR